MKNFFNTELFQENRQFSDGRYLL